MTPQEVLQAAFDKSVNGVLAQGCKSTTSEDNCSVCAYRGDDGARCAIGQLLTDEQIQKYGIKEGATPDSFQEDLIEEMFPGVQGETALAFMTALQNAHDGAPGYNFKYDFWKRANDVAATYNLTGVSRP
jgi:hypothetical protein